MNAAPRPSRSALLLAPLFLFLGLSTVGLPTSAAGQASGDGSEVRVGLTLGGIGLAGIVVEFRDGDNSIDVNLATFTFHDLSVSVVGKRYIGGGDARPFVGAGLWGVFGRAEEGPGSVLLLRAPIGVDWRFVDDQFVGGAIAINEALVVRRPDPEDDTPPSRRPIPLPGFYYRWQPTGR